MYARKLRFAPPLETQSALTEPIVGFNPIVQIVSDLSVLYPSMRPLEILDHAMAPHVGTDPDFLSFGFSADGVDVYVDELEPPSQLTEIIRRAFASRLDPKEFLLLGVEMVITDSHMEARKESAAVAWQEAMLKFAARYRLWEDV